MAISGPQILRTVADSPINQASQGGSDSSFSRVDWVGDRTLKIGSGIAGPVAYSAIKDYAELLHKVYVQNGTYNQTDWYSAAGLNWQSDSIVIPHGVTFFVGFSPSVARLDVPNELRAKKVEGGLRIFRFNNQEECYNFSAINLIAQLETHRKSSFSTLTHRLWRRFANDREVYDAQREVEVMIHAGEVIFDSSTYLDEIKSHPSGVEIGKYVRRRIDYKKFPRVVKPFVKGADNLRALFQFKPAVEQALPHFALEVEASGNMFTSLTTIQLARQFLGQMKELFPDDRWMKMIALVDRNIIDPSAINGRASTYFDKPLVVITGVKK
jgi:hypothetical protein